MGQKYCHQRSFTGKSRKKTKRHLGPPTILHQAEVVELVEVESVASLPVQWHPAA